ncbi:MAG: hypothetical protein G3M70_07325 [Candidatus Nitronauta litoralis]|uniref:Uncharacterized protein n=1 Tax=Candidatus Nitronauta litoralis TaxID=2705533 RepID=A0A7T0BVG3_9BACT|nr:MAG: hypothetical protein G3M70_07325 [Candidatus Nitronauta litoralis]
MKNNSDIIRPVQLQKVIATLLDENGNVKEKSEILKDQSGKVVSSKTIKHGRKK